VYLHDSCLGVPVTQPPTCVPGNALITRSAPGMPLDSGAFPGNGPITTLTVSTDGRFATFLADDPALNGPPDQVVLWVVDQQSPGIPPALASVDQNGVAVTGEGVSMSADGRYLSFIALDAVTNLPTVYLRDLRFGATAVVATNATCTGHALSSEGRFVAFISGSNPLNLPGLLGFYAYVADMERQLVHLVSVDSAGNPVEVAGSGASISGDGTKVVFLVLPPPAHFGQLVVGLTGF
jgi:hypothetical protein